MKFNSMKFRGLIALLVIGVLFFAGKSWWDARFPTWVEEVLLPDGRIISVLEKRDYVDGYGTRKTWLTLSLPELGGERTWEEMLSPTMIGVWDAQVYIIGRPRGDKAFLHYGYPKFTYVAFRWNGVSFERIPFMDVPESMRREENVRWCMPPLSSDGKFLDQVSVAAEWCAWPKQEESVQPHFPRPKIVDLTIRKQEAKFWAQLTGNSPAAE